MYAELDVISFTKIEFSFTCCYCPWIFGLTLITAGFSRHAKNGEKRKTSEEIVLKSWWVRAISHPGVWTSHTGQTGSVTSFSPLRHSCTWAVCISAGQNMVPALSKWPEKRLGSSLVLKLYCIMLNRILTRYLQRFFISLHFSLSRENLCYQQGSLVLMGISNLSLIFPLQTSLSVLIVNSSYYNYTLMHHFFWTCCLGQNSQHSQWRHCGWKPQAHSRIDMENYITLPGKLDIHCAFRLIKYQFLIRWMCIHVCVIVSVWIGGFFSESLYTVSCELSSCVPGSIHVYMV